MACPTCAADLPPQAKFCHECGTPVAVRACPACGTPAERGKFCAECGTPIEGPAPAKVESPAGPVAERRVTSVLFGDLVGFTALSENRDPEEVRELLSRYFASCRTVIGRYGGTVEKFIGDAVMAVWGVPVAHEDDAERAVRAGLDLVETVAALGEDVGAPGLAMRVGVVTGEVAVTVGATAEGMVAGDAVNTASRVQSVAAPGQVWVDETTRSLTVAAIAYQDAGEHVVKGKVEPLRLFAARDVVAEVGGGQRVDGLEAPITGRERELRLVKELFHATQESQRPRLVVVDGEAGVGKSRLAWEFEKYADGLSATVRWHRGRCLSYGDRVAFWALAEAVRSRLGLTEPDTGDVVAARLEESLLAFVPDPVERDWLRPRVAGLIGAGQVGGFGREDLFAAWTTFFERLGEGEHAVVLVVDDAQYADDGLLDFLDHLLATARAAIFVLVLARPELLDRRHDLGGRRTTVVRLDPLDDETMATLVDGLVDGLPDEVRRALVERSEGVPLFAVETVRALIDRDIVIPRGGRYVPADGARIDIGAIGAPASLQALVAARLDALTPDERRVVADASVLGATFTRAGLAALAGDEGLDAVLGSLQRKEILGVQTDPRSTERGQLRFLQGVVRQVAYATQSRRDRKARHVAAADFLAGQLDDNEDLAVVVAQHLIDAADASGSTDGDVAELGRSASALLERAARRAQSLGAPAEAQRLLEMALARSGADTDAARIHLAAAAAAWDAGDFRMSAEHAERAAELFTGLGLPVDAGMAAARQASALNSLQEQVRAIDLALEAGRRLETVPGSERALLVLARALAAAYSARGDLERTGHYAERCVLLAEALQDMDALAGAHLALGVRYFGVAPVTAQALHLSSASIAREHGFARHLARALNNLSSLQMSRDLGAALGYNREGLEAARRSGSVPALEGLQANRVLILMIAGRLQEAEEQRAELADSVRDPGIRVIVATLGVMLGDALGRPIPPVDPGSGEYYDELSLAWAGLLEVLRRRSQGDLAAAADVAERTLHHALAAAQIDDDFVHLWPPLVEETLAAGDVERAVRLLEPVDSADVGALSPAVTAQHRRLRGLVGAARGDDPAGVEADLRAGIELLTAFGAVGQAARGREDYGRWLLAQGRPAEAAVELEAARATYTEIGAEGWLARMADVLPPAYDERTAALQG